MAASTAIETTIQYGHVEPVTVHFEDLDAMGVVHNARHALLVERALAAFWRRRGHSFDAAGPTTPDTFNVVREFSITYGAPIRGTGEITVHLWIESLGESSGVYGFRLTSPDGAVVYAEGRRAVVKLDPATLRPAPWTEDARSIARSLRRPS